MMRIAPLIFFAIGLFSLGVASRPMLAGLKPRQEQPFNVRVAEFEGMNDQAFDLVMVGDSLTDRGRWNELLNFKSANRGIGRDTVLMVANRTEYIPTGTVFLMVGINDLSLGREPKVIAEDYRELLRRIENPEVVVQSVLGPQSLRVSDLNALLRELARDVGASFLDLTPAMGHPLKSELTIDGIHLTSEGYKIWASGIVDHIHNHQNRSD